MRRALVIGLVVVGAGGAVGLLAWGAGVDVPEASGSLSRRDYLLGLLALGVMTVAAVGFDIREWL